MEVCYLLLYGDLPTAPEKEWFQHTITHHTMVNEQLLFLYRGFRRDAHPMAVMVGVVGALSAFYHDSTDINDPQHRIIASHRLIAKIPTIAAMAYKYTIGQPFIYPQNDQSYAANFLRMTFAVPAADYKVSPAVARAMDRPFHPARRSRTERIDLDRAPCRLVRRKPICMHSGRDIFAVGAGPWGGERGSPQYAAGK